MSELLENGFRLGAAEIRPHENALLIAGTLIRIEPKAMSVLLALAGRGQHTVGREELIGEVWPRGFVSDDTLTRCISNLRSALGDDQKAPQYIITVPRKGYRLAQPSIPLDRPGASKGVVVFPFKNLSAGKDDYIVDGFTELLIARLSVALDQPVISRTTAMTFRHSDRDLVSICNQLGVRWAVEGSVIQTGEQVQIIVQLIDASTDSHAWAETWTRSIRDLLTVLNEISRLVAKQIGSKLQPGQEITAKKETLPSELLRHYLHGVQLNSRRSHDSLRQAINAFQKVLNAKADHAPSLSGLAMSHVLLAHYGAIPAAEGFGKARQYADAALLISPGQVDALVGLATVDFFYDWAFQRAEKFIERALAINPNLEFALALSANINLVNQRYERAQACIDRALEIDPLNIGLLMNAGDHLILQRRFGEAIEALEAALSIEPRFRPARLRLALAHAFKDQSAAAMSCLDQALELEGEDAPYWEYRAIVLGRLGEIPEAEAAARRLEELPHPLPGMLSWARARAWASAGDQDRAIQHLQRAFEMRSSSMPFLAATPVFDAIRQHPEVQALISKLYIT